MIDECQDGFRGRVVLVSGDGLIKGHTVIATGKKLLVVFVIETYSAVRGWDSVAT